MPAQQSSKERTTQARAPSQNGLDNAAQELAALLSSNDMFQYFQQIEAEVKKLRERNAALEITNVTNVDTFKKKIDELTDEKNKVVEEWKKDQATVKSLRDIKAEADKLLIHGKTQEDRILVQLETIKKKEAEVTRQETVRRQAEVALEKEKSTSESLRNTLKEMQDNLSRSTTKLDTAETSLATLQSFSVQLKPMAELKADISRRVCIRTAIALRGGEWSMEFDIEGGQESGAELENTSPRGMEGPPTCVAKGYT
ncbi:hypothetical protein PWT90_10274 [Aphanocladium album]|nr:hypothetical protein PWT90_10274 [Aphanocladium album]